MIVLQDTTESLVATLGGANAHDWVVSWDDVSVGGQVTHNGAEGQATAAAAFTLVPVATEGKRVVRSIQVRNTTSNTTTIVFGKKKSSTTRAISSAISLASGESLHYGPNGWVVYTIGGLVRTS